MAKMTKMIVESKADESESHEKDNLRTTDMLSKMIGSLLFVDGKYEYWKLDNRGNRIRFSRFYPEKKLYVDIFTSPIGEEEIVERGKLVRDNGFFYLPIRQGQNVKKDDILNVMR